MLAPTLVRVAAVLALLVTILVARPLTHSSAQSQNAPTVARREPSPVVGGPRPRDQARHLVEQETGRGENRDGDGNRATGLQHFIFVDQQTHALRLGWYNDEYVRTPDGWRIRRRSTTFMRKHGVFDSGTQHDPLAESAEGATT